MTGVIAEGKKALIIRVSVTNTTDVKQHFLPVNQVFIKGSGDTIYQMTPVAGVPDPIVAGEVASGATLEGDISFMVNETDTQLQLYIDTRWNGVTPTVVRL